MVGLRLAYKEQWNISLFIMVLQNSVKEFKQ